MTARHWGTIATLTAGLALLALVAWQSGAKAVHYASDPSREPCPALAPGDHTLVSRAIDAEGRVQPAADDADIKLKRTYWEANEQWVRKIRI